MVSPIGPSFFNLGHGILPDTPVGHVERMLRRIRGGSGVNGGSVCDWLRKHYWAIAAFYAFTGLQMNKVAEAAATRRDADEEALPVHVGVRGGCLDESAAHTDGASDPRWKPD
jgi:hypothetical protein